MSIYAVDASRRELIVAWPDAIGQSAHLIAPLSDSTVAAAARLSHDLSRLSSALWDTYVRPASGATDEQEFSRRQDERDLVDTVVDAVQNPPMPDESEMMIVSYSPIEFAAHRVGRELHRLGDAEFSRLISVDVEAEADSVRRAELGDLSGRAVQAVALDRVDASPVQVAAADAFLCDRLLDDALLTATFDPAAATVAAAHWLAAAAVTAAEIAGGSSHDVFVRADDIHACSIAVPSDVVAQICDAQQTALEAVVSMLKVAVAAGEGEIIDLEGIVARRAALRQMLTQYNLDAVEASLAAEPPRSTDLDPRRPARDMLEHLLDGIASCRRLYAEYADADDDNFDDEDDEFDDDIDDGAGDMQRQREIDAEFIDLVREEAAAERARLM
jgi:hypothetical protein